MAKRARNSLINIAVGYVRRSTDKQEQSIPDQKKTITAYAVSKGFKLSKFYIDDAISGTSTVKRRAFLRMLEDAESDLCEFKYIIVYDVKRFGRLDNDEVGYYIRQCIQRISSHFGSLCWMVPTGIQMMAHFLIPMKLAKLYSAALNQIR